MSKKALRIVGAKMPEFSANADRLEGGSVIEGRFNAWANNFHHENVGYDLGKFVCDTYYAGLDTHTANHPDGYTWDGFAFAQPNQAGPFTGDFAPRTGYSAKNIRGLLRDNLSVGHAILQEGFIGGHIDNVVGLGGVHAHVIKAKGVRGGAIGGYGASVNDVIFKSDGYAAGGDIKLASVSTGQAPPGITPWWGLTTAQNGLNLNPATASMAIIQIGSLATYGCGNGITVDGGAGQALSDIQIGQWLADGVGVSMARAMNALAVIAKYRFQIGLAVLNNAVNGVYWSANIEQMQQELEIGKLRVSVETNGIMVDGYGRVRVDSYSTDAVTNAYFHATSDCRIVVGSGPVGGFTQLYGNNPWQFGTGWGAVGGGNSTPFIELSDYRVRLRGLWKNTGAAAQVASLPSFLRPTENKRSRQYSRDTTAPLDTDVLVTVTAAGSIVLNGGVSTASAGDYVSLDGISWEIV